MKKMMETTTLDLGWVLSLEASILPFFSCVPCISKCHKIRTFFWTPQNETVWLKKIYYYKIYQNRGLPIQWMMFLFIMVDSIQQFLLSERIFQILELPCPVWFLVFLRHIWGCGCFWTVFDLNFEQKNSKNCHWRKKSKYWSLVFLNNNFKHRNSNLT